MTRLASAALLLFYFAACGVHSAEGTSALHGPGALPAPPLESVSAGDRHNREPVAKATARFAVDPEHGVTGQLDAPALERRLEDILDDGFAVERNGHFVIVSDAPVSELSGPMLSTLILCREALLSEFFRSRPEKPIVVYAFRDGESYRKHLRDFWNETPISPYGHYNYVRRHIVFNYETGMGTMVHEMVHALMDADMPQAPIWIAEGMASLYEQCRVEGRSIRGLVNWRLPELQRKIRTDEITPLADLLKMDDGEFKRKESLHYAEARFFCMFMEQRGLFRKFYRTYREQYDRDPTGRQFVEQVFGKPIAQVQEEYIGWALRLRPVASELASSN